MCSFWTGAGKRNPFLMLEFPCILSLYYIKNQQDATLELLFISHCKITLHVSDAFCVHHQENCIAVATDLYPVGYTHRPTAFGVVSRH